MTKNYWDKMSLIYELFMRKDKKAYKQMYSLIKPTIKDKTVLELATGTGLIARNVCDVSNKYIATDYSSKMISQASIRTHCKNVSFEIADATSLQYNNNEFDIVIISNTLHIMPNPEKALLEINRVLKPNGILIAPTFTHGKIKTRKKMLVSIMKKTTGFEAVHAWSQDNFIEYLEGFDWKVVKVKSLKASFPLTYVECKK